MILMRKKTTYSTTVEYGRKAYYIKKNDYHSYVSKYFDQEDEPVVAEPKTFKEKVFSFIKDLFNR